METEGKLERIEQLRRLGYNTPRIMKIPRGTVLDDGWRARMRALAAGDRRMTVRSYHPTDEIAHPRGPFRPEIPFDEAVAFAAETAREWNVLFQEAIDVADTRLAGRVLLRPDGSGHYEVLRGAYRVRDLDHPPASAADAHAAVSFDSPEAITDAEMRHVITALRALPRQVAVGQAVSLPSGSDGQADSLPHSIIVEFNVQQHPSGLRREPLLLWEWRPAGEGARERAREGESERRGRGQADAGSGRFPRSLPLSLPRSVAWVYGWGVPGLPEVGDAEEARTLLGGKGASLMRLAAEGLPVPPGFALSTRAFHAFARRGKLPRAAERALERTYRRLGILDFGFWILDWGAKPGLSRSHVPDPQPKAPNPKSKIQNLKSKICLVSVRSSAAVSMPGMMDTILNVGCTPETVAALGTITGDASFGWRVGRRFLLSFARAAGLLDFGFWILDFGLGTGDSLKKDGQDILDEEAQSAIQNPKSKIQNPDEAAERFRAGVAALAERGVVVPLEPGEQLRAAVAAVLASWNTERARRYREVNGIPDDLGTAVVVQLMVHGDLDADSGSGVGFTRDPLTGDPHPRIEYLPGGAGEEIVGGRTVPAVWTAEGGGERERGRERGREGRKDGVPIDPLTPSLPHSLTPSLYEVSARLEVIFGDAQEFEFTVERGALYLLQSRTARRTDAAAVRIAYDLWAAGRWSREEARERLRGIDLEALRERRLAPGDRRPRARAIVASPGAVVGPVALTAEGATRLAAGRRPPILVREDLAPEDYPLLEMAAGVLTRHGGVTSHAAVVARQRRRVCLVGCRELVFRSMEAGSHPGERETRSTPVGGGEAECVLGGVPLREGDLLSLDGATGRIYDGTMPLGPPVMPAGADEALLAWARQLLEYP